MKRTALCLLIPLLALLVSPVRAEVVALWDYNSQGEPDNDPATGTLAPKVGTGMAAVIGPTIAYVFQGSSSSDEWVFDNSCLRIASFPPATAHNKTSGLELRFSTAGYEDISLTWEHNNNSTASRYLRVQYTADGDEWTDYIVLTNEITFAWYFRTVDFAGVPAADNNPNFGVRLVTEFEATAIGEGTNSYVGISDSYNPAGTFWSDLVQANGTPVNPANTRPTLSHIPDQIVRTGSSLPPIAFTVGDAETPAADLTVSGEFSNPNIIQSLSFGGSGASRTVTVTPTGALGASRVIVRVTDGGGRYTERLFLVSTLPANTPPTISAITNRSMLANTTASIDFTVGDLESSPASLVVSVAHAERSFVLVQTSITGTGANRTLLVTPLGAGMAQLTVTVSDGELQSSSTFLLRVTRPQTAAFWDFNSPVADTNGATGTLLPAIGTGEAQVIGTLTTYRFQASANSDPNTTDQSALRTTGYPAVDANNKTSGVQFLFSTVGLQRPSVIWEHNNNASASRYWRVQYTTDGHTWTDHAVRSNIWGIWVFFSTDFAGVPGVDNNPNFGFRVVSEFESTATGAGVEGYVARDSNFNYSGSSGTMWMDMVTITADAYSPAVQLDLQRSGNDVVISWPTSASGVLESASSLIAPVWLDAPETPVISGDRKIVTVGLTSGARFFRLRN
jgi:hypothetical protein